ncbi:hypothetical protein H2201_004531 [Coniosporium apollinis]|uniref:HNH nuclease domain-containing protein n=1 Tax=Coniosporium apollinis TaxID=61459 RepID=A0ABQ9NXY6_9PEZI|nr:hypothetical protein H2201_004531 [Coniosporium apollinis]
MPPLTFMELRQQLFANAALLFNAHYGSKTHSIGTFDAVIASVADDNDDFVRAALVFHPSTAFKHARVASNGFTPADAPLQPPSFKFLLKGPARPEPYDAVHALLMLTAHMVAERIEMGFSSTTSSDSMSGVVFRMDTSPVTTHSSKFGTDIFAGKATHRVYSEPSPFKTNGRTTAAAGPSSSDPQADTTTSNVPILTRQRSRTIVPALPIRQAGQVIERRNLSGASVYSLPRTNGNSNGDCDEGSATEVERTKDEDDQTYAGL